MKISQYGIRQSAELEHHMTSVERISEYTNVPSEGIFETIGKNLLPKNWPMVGTIEFVSLSLRYEKNSRKILNNLSFNVKAMVNRNFLFRNK